MKIYALLALAGVALALPQQGGKPAPQPGQPGQPDAPPTGKPKGNATCNETQKIQVAQLTDGIQSNLDIQALELQGIQSMQKLASNGTANNAAFAQMQQLVLSIQQKGIDLRANNQKLATSLNSPAQMGLATVAMAQVLEVMQVKTLTGSAADAKTLDTLVKEVMDGTKQNQMNKQAAAGQCRL